MTPNPPIPGHKLLAEGFVRPYRNFPQIMYRGGCECGATPPTFPDISAYAMKRWHRRHKAEIREAAANEDERQAAQWPL